MENDSIFEYLLYKTFIAYEDDRRLNLQHLPGPDRCKNIVSQIVKKEKMPEIQEQLYDELINVCDEIAINERSCISQKYLGIYKNISHERFMNFSFDEDGDNNKPIRKKRQFCFFVKKKKNSELKLNFAEISIYDVLLQWAFFIYQNKKRCFTGENIDIVLAKEIVHQIFQETHCDHKIENKIYESLIQVLVDIYFHKNKKTILQYKTIYENFESNPHIKNGRDLVLEFVVIKVFLVYQDNRFSSISYYGNDIVQMIKNTILNCHCSDDIIDDVYMLITHLLKEISVDPEVSQKYLKMYKHSLYSRLFYNDNDIIYCG